MKLPIVDNPYCKHCKRKYCKNNKIKEDNIDDNIIVEMDVIKYLSECWGVELKQTDFKYCPLDFYSPEIPLMGDVTTPWNKKWLHPITKKWSTPGWVIEYFKLSTLIDSASNVGLLSFYVWSFKDKIMSISATDAVKNTLDTMVDPLTIYSGLNNKKENSDMPRSKGKYFNPHRLFEPTHYKKQIDELVEYYENYNMIDSIDELIHGDY